MKGSIVGLVVGVVVARPSPGHLIVGNAISLPPALFKANPVGSASLIKQLMVCVHRHASAACSKPFAMRAEQEFALFEQLTTTAPTVAIFDTIVDGIATLNRQYKTLVHELS